MTIPLFLAPILTELAKNGLGMLASAIQAKGKEVIEEKIGVKIPSKVEELTPELMQQLQIRQMEYEEFLIEAAAKADERELRDIADARARDAEIVKATGERNKRADAMIGGAAVCLVVLMVIVVWNSDFDDFQKSTLSLILGRALGYIDQVFQFEFGTTRTSKKKDESIERLTRR